MDDKSKKILAQYTLDAVNILDHSIQLYDSGHDSFYRVAATQLRILLCDTTFRHDHHEDIAIMPILFPDLKLLRLSEDCRPLLSEPKIDLQTWLDSQADPDSSLTIRQLIRRVCDIDGGAHVDIKPQAGISNQETARLWIIGIGKYISPLISQELHS
jgi:hypothetical protein